MRRFEPHQIGSSLAEAAARVSGQGRDDAVQVFGKIDGGAHGLHHDAVAS